MAQTQVDRRSELQGSHEYPSTTQHPRMNSWQSPAIADILAWAAIILAAIATAAGLFGAGLHRDVPFWAQQARGIDLATLFLAVPILVIALLAVRGGSSIGRLVVVGALLYLVYNYVIYTTSVAMNRLRTRLWI